MKKENVTCENCGITFKKVKKEITRSLKLGRKQYCSLSCSKKTKDNLEHWEKVRLKDNISSLNPFNRKDEYTIFRPHLRRANQRNKFCDLTLEQLKEVWDKQQGICIYSKVKLISSNYNERNNPIYTMSLDRINSEIGYTKNNIQFVSVAMNHLKHSMTHEQMLEILNILK